jgi:hypothetical protein
MGATLECSKVGDRDSCLSVAETNGAQLEANQPQTNIVIVNAKQIMYRVV